ncbi:methyl-accepting chemotaxis protein [Botrimarina hoheduenensis]|uniref:Biofilm dispersion protein BdlA n=1 Tax=Botrimarina hoheduenensis TaxID=2528000 RepID=A0A5C5WF85_9BACT|nr:PAS domain-containing methyl-accepting chemotaxis protein [Botrimarina hoheduenensis]TWT48733.1 Biofilm dispersion protein BdlA [Botrimarina hoheduenensis]
MTLTTTLSTLYRKPTAKQSTAEIQCESQAAEIALLRGRLNAISRSQAVIEFELDGTIITANDNFLNAVGYTLDEIQGRHHRIFVDPAEAALPSYANFWRDLGAGQFDSGEYRRITKNGDEIWILASYNPVYDDNGKPVRVVKFAADITARKNQSADWQRQVVEAISKSQAVIEFLPDGTILTANPNFLSAVGYGIEEIRGKHHRLFCDSAYTDSDEYRDFWKRLASGLYQSGQYQRFGKGGRSIWIQASYNPIVGPNGNVIKVIKYASDITAQIETNQQAAAVGQTVASSVTEMVSTIEEIAKNVSRTATLAHEAKSMAESTGKEVQGLDQASRRIGEVVSVIQELADQTNLLALNATIEAARAGESGRSFAVVASEVKELANATAKATENIEISVREIQQSIAIVVTSTEQITGSVSEVSSNTNTVAAAIEEQSATMAGLGRTAEELQALTISA